MAKEPTQRNLGLGFRDDAGRMARAPLPRPIVEEITPIERNYTTSDKPLTRGQTGLGDVVTDSRERMRANAQHRGAPTQPDLLDTNRAALERSGLNDRSQRALQRAKNFTSTTGTVLNPPTNTPRGVPRPGIGKAAGGVLGLGLGASEIAMNAANVYDRTDGDVGATVKQAAYDAPGAILGTIGGIAGAGIGRRNPAAAVSGSLAGGTIGYNAGEGIASGVNKLTGGDGRSPLDTLRAEEQQAAMQYPGGTLNSDGSFDLTPGPDHPSNSEFYDQDVPVVPETIDASDPRHPNNPNYVDPSQVAEPAPQQLGAEPVPQAAIPEEGEEEVPEQPVYEQGEGGWGNTGIEGIAGRSGDDGVPEFSNRPEALGAARGDFTAGGRMGNGKGTFSVVSGGREAMESNNKATEIYRDMATTRQMDRMTGQQRVLEQRMQANDSQINSLMATGRPRDRMAARGLQQQNAALGEQYRTAVAGRENLELGRLTADTARRTAASSLAEARALQAARNQEYKEGAGQATAIEEAAKRNAEGFDQRIENVFGKRDRDGDVSVPPEAMKMIELRQGSFAEQRREAMGSAIQELSSQAQAGAPGAAEKLARVQQQFAKMEAEMFRVGPNGEGIEPRPVREWPQEEQDMFFRDVENQTRLQADKTDSIVPEVAGGLVGLAAGARAASKVKGIRAKLGAAAIGTVLGSFGGGVAEQKARGQRSTAPQGSANESLLIPNNLNSVYADGDALMVQTRDGQLANFKDLMQTDVNPSKYLGMRGDQTSESQPVARAAFTKALQLATSGGQGSKEAAEALELMASNGQANFRNMLTATQRTQLADFLKRGQ